MSVEPSRSIPTTADALDIKLRVDQARVTWLYSRGPIALAAVIINAVILTGLLWGRVRFDSLAIWLGTLAAITVARAALILAYRRASTGDGDTNFSARRWESWFALGALMNGGAWGFGTASFLSVDLEYQIGVLFVAGGMVAGASSSSATSMRSFAAFTIPAAMPAIVRLLLEGTASHLVLGTTSFVFIGAMSWMAWQGGRVLRRSIRLRLENDALVRELADRSRERAGRLQHLIDYAEVVTIVADPATSSIVDASKNATALLGATAPDLVGRSLIGSCGLEPLADRAAWRSFVDQARLGRGHFVGPLRATVFSPEHAGRHIELKGTIRDVGGTEYILLVVNDITERKALHEQMARSQLFASLGTLCAGVAHEINNPLTSILSNLRMLTAHLPTSGRPPPHNIPPAQVLLDDALEGAERVRQTVTHLLTTSTASFDGAQDSDLRQVLQTMLKVADPEIRHSADVVFDAQPTPRVRAEPLRLYQVLLPLILDAARRSTEGGLRHRITVRIRHDAPERMIRLEIDDSRDGLSLPPDPNPTSLLVGQSIVKELGGSLQVEGSRRTVRLPAVTPARSPAPEPTGIPTEPTQGLSILIVDDDAFVARALKRLMSSHTVTIETNPMKAIEMLATAQFDAVLCDLMMPDMSGMDFYRHLAQTRPAMADRIIFMTGGAFSDTASSFLTNVNNACLTKPFDIKALNSAIDKLRSEQHRQSAN